jgi:ceramide glucosyltransferase
METEEVSTLGAACGILVFVYYVSIWSISLLGLSQARQKFGAPARRKHRPVLPSLQSTTPASSTAQEGSFTTIPNEGISILRPLAGLDHNLLTNLSTSFEQDFPPNLFEVILSVRSEQDQALEVAREVCSRYPHINSKIIIGDEGCSGVNPKIANLVRSYAASQFDILWVLDSQVQLSSLALHRAIQAMRPSSAPPTPSPRLLKRRPHGHRVGLAHHVPLAVTPHSTSLGSHIEAIFLGTNHAKMYLAINALSVDSCVMGKSNFYRKSDLANVPDDFFNVGAEGTRGESGAIGSIAFLQPDTLQGRDATSTGSHDVVSTGLARPLARFGIFLAEDNMLALSLWRPPLSLGHVLLDGDVARMTVGDVKSVGDYVKRRIRWIRVRRYMVPAATYIEPLTESIVCGIIATWAFSNTWLPFLSGVPSSSFYWLTKPTFFLIHLLLWHLLDFAVLASLQEAGKDKQGDAPIQVIDFHNPSQVLTYRLAWLCRELLAFPIWITALCGSTVTWRDRTYRILSDARAARVETEDHDGDFPSPSSSSRFSFSDVIPRLFFSHHDRRRKRFERLPTSEEQD